MSRFFNTDLRGLIPYTPGEQPGDGKYIKLNTNESPYPPSEKARLYASKEAEKLNLYPDPLCSELHTSFAKKVGVNPDMVLATNGSDEILNFAFMAFCNKITGAVFPDITYGFYPVFAELNGVSYEEIPLRDDFSIDPTDYIGKNKTIFIANPNAPTGLLLSLSQIEEILKGNPDSVVVIDEAYIDFGGESAVKLLPKYENLLITATFSKSRSMAGARLGFGIGSKELIHDLNTVKYSTNPYNINKMTMATGIGTLEDDEYTKTNCRKIIRTRDFISSELLKLGFTLTDSKANFIFVKHPKISGKELYSKLKERKILVRHFTNERICEYNRITIGTREEMTALVSAVKNILEG